MFLEFSYPDQAFNGQRLTILGQAQFPLMYLAADCPEICSSQASSMFLDNLDNIFTVMDPEDPRQDKRDDVTRIVGENSKDFQCHDWEQQDPKTNPVRSGPYGGSRSPGPWDAWWQRKAKQLRDTTEARKNDPHQPNGHPELFSKIPQLLPKFSPVFKPPLPNALLL